MSDKIEEKEQGVTVDTEVEKEQTTIEIEAKPEYTEVEEQVEKETDSAEVAEVELEDDPWSEESWKLTFPELYEKQEDSTERVKELTDADVVKIVREQIKLWLKGVDEGKYPLPKKLLPPPEKYPYPEKEFGELKKSIDELTSKSKERGEKLDTMTKSLEETRKELQIIKDTPAEFVEKSIKAEKKTYNPGVEIVKGSIRKAR